MWQFQHHEVHCGHDTESATFRRTLEVKQMGGASFYRFTSSYEKYKIKTEKISPRFNIMESTARYPDGLFAKSVYHNVVWSISSMTMKSPVAIDGINIF